MKHNKPLGAAILCASALILTGCGGDDSDTGAPTTTSEAAGLWVGITDTNRAISGLVLDDGTFYVLYSQIGNPALIGGIVQGHSTSSNGSFTSTDARDFSLEGLGVLDATISASYSARQSFNGTVMYTTGGAATFTSNYDSQYDLTPSLTTLAGTYTGQVAVSVGAEDAVVTVSDTGAVTGIGASGCTITGSASPRSSGNVYNLSITFGGAPCYYAGQTLSGIAYYDSDPSDKRLYAAAPNAARTGGFLFVGMKP